jgi:hypothetical protein
MIHTSPSGEKGSVKGKTRATGDPRPGPLCRRAGRAGRRRCSILRRRRGRRTHAPKPARSAAPAPIWGVSASAAPLTAAAAEALNGAGLLHIGLSRGERLAMESRTPGEARQPRRTGAARYRLAPPLVRLLRLLSDRLVREGSPRQPRKSGCCPSEAARQLRWALGAHPLFRREDVAAARVVGIDVALRSQGRLGVPLARARGDAAGLGPQGRAGRGGAHGL